MVEAPVAGLILYDVEPGDTVAAGQRLARIVDPLREGGPSTSHVVSPISGRVMRGMLRGLSRAGDVVAKVAGSGAHRRSQRQAAPRLKERLGRSEIFIPSSATFALEWTVDDSSAVAGDPGVHASALLDPAWHEVLGSELPDLLEGGQARDWIEGYDGNDSLFGGAGEDRIYGGVGDDVVHGGAGADFANGGDGNDFVWGDAGNDSLLGDSGRGCDRGRTGDDYLAGMDGSDLLLGRPGDDVLTGGNGADSLLGEDGSDRLDGGDGNDG